MLVKLSHNMPTLLKNKDNLLENRHFPQIITCLQPTKLLVHPAPATGSSTEGGATWHVCGSKKNRRAKVRQDTSCDSHQRLKYIPKSRHSSTPYSRKTTYHSGSILHIRPLSSSIIPMLLYPGYLQGMMNACG